MVNAHERLAWLDERRGGIGASDVPAILGISPWRSSWSVWVEKLGLVGEQEASDSMRLGSELEPIIGRWFTERTGLEIGGEQTLVRHRRARHHFATLDGFVFDGPGRDEEDQLGVFEAKYSAESWEELPAHYRAQVMWQLYVTGLPRAWVAALLMPFGRPRLEIFELERSEEEIASSVTCVTRFWEDHVLARQAPPPDGHPATADAIVAAWGHLATRSQPAIDLTDWSALIEQHAELGDEIRTLGKRRERVGAHIEALFGELGPDRSEGFVDGRLAISWRSEERRSIDLEAVRAEHGDRYDRIRTQRVLRHHQRRIA